MAKETKAKKFQTIPVDITPELIEIAEVVGDAGFDEYGAKMLREIEDHTMEATFGVFNDSPRCTIMKRPELRGGITFAVVGFGQNYYEALCIAYTKVNTVLNWRLNAEEKENRTGRARFG